MKLSVFLICIASLIYCGNYDTRETSKSPNLSETKSNVSKTSKKKEDPVEGGLLMIILLACGIMFFPFVFGFYCLSVFLDSLAKRKE